MIKRRYFIKVEIVPQERDYHLYNKNPVICSGIVAYKSIFQEPIKAKQWARDLIIEGCDSFTVDNTIVTAFNRV